MDLIFSTTKKTEKKNRDYIKFLVNALYLKSQIQCLHIMVTRPTCVCNDRVVRFNTNMMSRFKYFSHCILLLENKDKVSFTLFNFLCFSCLPTGR